MGTKGADFTIALKPEQQEASALPIGNQRDVREFLPVPKMGLDRHWLSRLDRPLGRLDISPMMCSRQRRAPHRALSRMIRRSRTYTQATKSNHRTEHQSTHRHRFALSADSGRVPLHILPLLQLQSHQPRLILQVTDIVSRCPAFKEPRHHGRVAKY